MCIAAELKNITKIYSGFSYKANNSVTFDLHKGEILAIAGENGAGKSTLMKILYGLEMPTNGEIYIDGKKVSISSPRVANKFGIGMVHQHFMLFPEFTVAQNVVMGVEPVKFNFFYDFKKAEKQITEIIKQHNFSVSANVRVSDLTVGQMQQVEILKMLYRNADILILDEPTAVLTEQEISSLFQTLKNLSSAGKSLIVITHKLSEIKRISDRVVVMRQGEVVGVRETKSVDEYEIFLMMMGEERNIYHSNSVKKQEKRSVILSFNDVSVKKRKQERPLLNNVSFTLHRGEILGFAGVGGNGLETLEAVLGGFLHITSGSIFCDGDDISKLSVQGLRKKGLAYIPADRLQRGAALDASVSENIIIGRRKEFAHNFFLDFKGISNFANTLFERYSISSGKKGKMKFLSGGNIQKVILAREIDLFKNYIVFSEPTWGLSVSASNYVYEQMAVLREKGAGIILISSNLDEILTNVDRILVFYHGAIVAEITDVNSDPSIKETIGAYMLGLNTCLVH